MKRKKRIVFLPEMFKNHAFWVENFIFAGITNQKKQADNTVGGGH